MITAPVSVVIPVRNGAHLIGEALRTVENQTWRPEEIIVVDGDSNDNPEDVTKRYKNTIFVHDRKANAAEGRNIGVARASQPFLAFFDADDLWPKNRIESLLGPLLKDDQIDIATGMMQQFRLSPNKEMLFKGSPVASQLPTVSLMSSKAFWRVGPFSSEWKIGETVEWCARAHEVGLKRVTISETVLFRRLHENNLGRSVDAPMQAYLKIIHRTLERRRAAGRVSDL